MRTPSRWGIDIVGVSARADVTQDRRTGSNPRMRTLVLATSPLTKLRRVDAIKVSSRRKVVLTIVGSACNTLLGAALRRQDQIERLGESLLARTGGHLPTSSS